MKFRYCIFSHYKKIILEISAHINKKCFQFFQENACPCIDYNCCYIKILNKQYYEFIKAERKYCEETKKLSGKFRRIYDKSILDYFQGDWVRYISRLLQHHLKKFFQN